VLDRRSDGSEFPVYLNTSLVKDGSARVIGLLGVAQDITERKKFVEDLQRQQAEMRVLFDLIPAMIWFKDANNKILRLNKRAAEITGKSAQEIEGKSTFEIHPQEAAKYYADDLEVIRSGLPKLGIVEVVRTPDGKEHWIRTDKVPYCDKAGNVIGIVVVAQDITDRKRAEESVLLLGSAVEQSKESIVITDAELNLPGPRILFVNPAFTRMTGYTPDEVLGKTPRILQGPRSDKAVLRKLRQNLLRGEPFLGETLNYRKDGTEFYLEWQVTPIRGASGAITHFVAIQRDITDRKLAERKMITLAHAIETTSELISITDLEDRFTFVNQAFLKAYGYEEHEIMGKTTDILFSPSNPPALWMQILVQSHSGGWRGELYNRRKDGTEFPLSLSTSHIVDGLGHVVGLMGVARDITDRKRLEREILEICDREQGRIGQDLHDGLCQQLVSTAFASNLLSQKLATIAPSEADAAKQIAGWLDEAISQARSLARGLYPVKLEADGLASALQELADYVNGRLGITCVFEDPQAVSIADNSVATHLYRIAQEAVTNAVKHSKANRILINLTSQGDDISVRVQDDGVGFPDVTTNGMGLHIMEYRARMIGGSFKIERGPDGGTVAVCSLHRQIPRDECGD
jgi:PAS domain S-box-containing protein